MACATALTALTVLACHEEGDNLSTCGSPCYSGPPRTLGVGTCRAGHIECDGTRTSTVCVGDVTPQVEYCDSTEDTDCSGKVGDHDPKQGWACGKDTGNCRQGLYVCARGELSCQGDTEPEMEDCSGRDMDCDGRPNNIAPVLCYTGDAQDLTHEHAACRAGVERCSNGGVACFNEVLPSTEVCDGLSVDEDCNGFVDDVELEELQAVDVVLLVDRSGSMLASIEAVKTSLLLFIADHPGELYRYAIIDVPGPSTTDHTPGMSLPLSQAETASAAVTMLSADHQSVEYSYDALWGLAVGQYDVGWRSNTHRLAIFFGDEAAQTDLGLLQSAVAQALKLARIRTFVFTKGMFTTDYEKIADATGGDVYSIETIDVDLPTVLPKILERLCQ